jgi:hypothetical protein
LSPWWLMQAATRHEVARAGFGSVAIATCGHVVWQMGTAYDDLIVTLEFLGVLLLGFPPASLQHRTHGDNSHALTAPSSQVAVNGGIPNRNQTNVLQFLPLGIVLGALVASKLYLIPFAVLVFLIWSIRRPIRQVAVCIAAGALSAGPLFLMRWIQTGNPVFPQFNGLFKSELFSPVNTNWNMPYDRRSGWLDALSLPFRAGTTPSSFVEVVPGGGMGALVVGFAFVALGVLFGTDRRIAMSLCGWLAVWWLQLRYLRYALPMLIAALLLLRFRPSGPASGSLDTPRFGRVVDRTTPFITALFISVFVWPTAASFWNIPERLPTRVATGRESRDDYLHRTVLAYPAIEFLNREANPGDRIVGSPLVARVLLAPHLDVSPRWEADQQVALQRNQRSVSSASSLPDRYRSVGYEWIVTMASERFAEPPQTDPLVENFARQLAWTGNGIEVYRLTDATTDNAYTCAVQPNSAAMCGKTKLDLHEGVLTLTGGCIDDLARVDVIPAAPTVPMDTIETDGPDVVSFNRVTHQGVVQLAQSKTGPSTRIAFSGLAPTAPVKVSLLPSRRCAKG